MKKKWGLLLLGIITVSLFHSLAKTQELTGLQIMEKVYSRQEPKDQTAKLTMTLKQDSGNERIREIQQYTKQYPTMEKKIMFFISPADVRNTSFMTWSYHETGKEDDQWIFLPALKKIRRISSDSKSDYFMGSDFTYDDLGDRHPAKDDHKILSTEILNGEECYVIESSPKEKNYMYSKTITWVIKDKWIGLQKKFYNEEGEYQKILNIKKYAQIDGFWIITESVMRNILKEHTTMMMLSDLKINTSLKDQIFNARTMERGLQ